jgi:hypothetical protein
MHKIKEFLFTKINKKKLTIVFITVFVLSVLIMLIFNWENREDVGVFYKSEISDDLKQEIIGKNIWHDGCPVALDRLRLLNVSYVNFKNESVHDGKIMVMDIAADRVLRIFKTLYHAKFPIASVKLINEFNGDDFASMEANNTSSFNCRKTVNGKFVSLHSYGLAFDLNPLQNPYVDNDYELGKESMKVYPSAGMEYLNRAILKPGMVENIITHNKQEITVSQFIKDNGFKTWGGDWNFPLDWQHFQVSKENISRILELEPQAALEFFNSLSKEKDIGAKLD